MRRHSRSLVITPSITHPSLPSAPTHLLSVSKLSKFSPLYSLCQRKRTWIYTHTRTHTNACSEACTQTVLCVWILLSHIFGFHSCCSVYECLTFFIESNSPSYNCTTSCLTIQQWMHTYIVSFLFVCFMRAVMKMFMYKFCVDTFLNSLGYISRSWIAGPYWTVPFWNVVKTVFQCGCTILHSHQQVWDL